MLPFNRERSLSVMADEETTEIMPISQHSCSLTPAHDTGLSAQIYWNIPPRCFCVKRDSEPIYLSCFDMLFSVIVFVRIFYIESGGTNDAYLMDDFTGYTVKRLRLQHISNRR